MYVCACLRVCVRVCMCICLIQGYFNTNLILLRKQGYVLKRIDILAYDRKNNQLKKIYKVNMLFTKDHQQYVKEKNQSTVKHPDKWIESWLIVERRSILLTHFYTMWPYIMKAVLYPNFQEKRSPTFFSFSIIVVHRVSKVISNSYSLPKNKFPAPSAESRSKNSQSRSISGHRVCTWITDPKNGFTNLRNNH